VRRNYANFEIETFGEFRPSQAVGQARNASIFWNCLTNWPAPLDGRRRRVLFADAAVGRGNATALAQVILPQGAAGSRRRSQPRALLFLTPDVLMLCRWLRRDLPRA
jgi:hypothetical protein